MEIGRSIQRVDAFDKVTGRARFTDDLCPHPILEARILHSTIANGWVKSMDVSRAQALPGVVKVLTCFDVPPHQYPTPGHPWSVEEAHQDVSDRRLLNRRVRIYGDDIAAVVAEDALTARRGLGLIQVEYEEYPPVLTPAAALAEGMPPLHEEYPGNVLKRHTAEIPLPESDFKCAEDVLTFPGYHQFRGHYETQQVQHCHMEPPISYAYAEGERICVVTSTQIPHIVRRVVGQALGIPWGRVRVVKPYIGGGFGNKQEVLYEPLNAWLCAQVGGRPVRLEVSREETFQNTRSRHPISFDVRAAVDGDGYLMARECVAVSNQGGYASHGHAIVSNAVTGFRQTYLDQLAHRSDAWTVYTNIATPGAMRGYGIPQANFALECMMEDIALQYGLDPLAFRLQNLMPQGYVDPLNGIVCHSTGARECVEKGRHFIHWDELRAKYQNQTGPVRRGVGMALFWYNTAVWPISLESCSCRMVLNQDGSLQVQTGETEIGQGCDTAFAQMAADAVGVPFEAVHVISTQDTDITPFGTGAYASRQTYVGGFAIRQTGELLREKILTCAAELTRQMRENLDLAGGRIVRISDGRDLMGLGELATEVLYSLDHSQHITAESTYQIKNNAYSFGCTFAEVEVDILLCQVKLLDIVNVHDCGKLINPALAEAQVHGGMSMGIGYGLSEQLLFDEKTGRPLNNNLLDYKLSTFMDHPNLRAEFVENPEPTSPFGTKALGEPPACSPAPAIRNAILHATGVALNDAPMTPHVLFARFKEEGLL